MLVIVDKELKIIYETPFEPSFTFAPSPIGDVYVMFCTSKLVSDLIFLFNSIIIKSTFENT